MVCWLAMNHPVPARLVAFARYRIDFGKEVQQHIEVCRECAHLVGQALSEEQERRRDRAAKPSSN